MILDQITLAGADAYLRQSDDAQAVNVAALPTQTVTDAVGPVRRARSHHVGDGMLVRVSAVQLYLEGDDLFAKNARTTLPWITLRVEKEMFPGLYSDPYAHRTHRIAGFEDFSRGVRDHLTVLEVDGVPTLVSTGADGTCIWRSPIYTMPAKLPFDAAAWDIPTHRTTPIGAFTYDVELHTWTADPAAAPPRITSLVSDATPQSPRFATMTPPVGARAYQIEFRAHVKHDAPLHERHLSELTRESIGRPLLTGVYLLEHVSDAYEFHSVSELMAQASTYELFGARTHAPQRILVTLEMSASLAQNESIVLDLHGNTPGVDVLEARLAGNVVLRPPRTEVGD
jgi:hypothetical protein